jgi:hypothetical protein
MASYPTYQKLDNVTVQPTTTKVLGDSDYMQKAIAQYDPSYNMKVQGMQNTLRNNLSNLENTKGTIDANYDSAVATQNLNNQQAKNNLNNDSLNRGLGRSSIVTSGLASADLTNNRLLAAIQANKTNSLNQLALQQANTSADEQNQENTMSANRLNDLQSLSDKLKDTDINRYDSELAANRNFYMQQLGYNQGVDQLNNTNFWKNQDQDNWQKTFDNNNYWKGIEQSNWQKTFDQNQTNADRNYGLEKDKFNYDVKSGDRNYDLQKASLNNSQASVNKRVSDAATEVYNNIYGANSKEGALENLYNNKSRILAQMTQAGMSALDAMAFYNGMLKDLK